MLHQLTHKEFDELTISNMLPPNEIVGKCLQCGNCCIYYECEHYDNGCTIYDLRSFECRSYPHNRDEINKVKCLGYKSLRG